MASIRRFDILLEPLQNMSRLLHEPLLHFVVLGALLFGLYGWLNRGSLGARDEIVVSSSELENLQNQFVRTWQRPPTPEEIQGLVDAWLREEVLYREGLAMGLDRDDPIVRRRITQKVTSLADGLVSADPAEPELQAWLDAHPDDYRVGPVFTLHQIYFDPGRHGDRIEADIATARATLARGQLPAGDATMLPETFEDAPAFEIGRVFGSEFAAQLEKLPVGSWQGPVESGYGLHLVKLIDRRDGRVPKLAEVRPAVERDLLSSRASEADEAYYRKLRARYKVRIDDAAVRAGGDSPVVDAQ
jgi:PPIC-type PPIASE domain